jgi:hypothetical protein
LRKCYPDFLVDDKIVEIKGPQDKLYVKEKYGKIETLFD